MLPGPTSSAEGTYWKPARRVEAEVRPFTPAQIKLLETFADQAVIAIENVRLFQELKESFANSKQRQVKILGVIASSPTDVQPVLDVVAQNAARLCDAKDAIIYRVESDHAQPVAHCGPVPALQNYYRPLSCGLPVGRTIIDRKTIHIHDVAVEIETEFPEARALQRDSGTRTCYSRRYCVRMSLSALFRFAVRKSVPSRINISLFSRPSPTRPLLPLKTSGCSKS